MLLWKILIYLLMNALVIAFKVKVHLDFGQVTRLNISLPHHFLISDFNLRNCAKRSEQDLIM